MSFYSNPLVQRFARLLYPYGSVRKVVAGAARGCRFHVAPGMGITYALGCDHKNAFAFLAKQVLPGQTVYDVGANQGQFSLLFARLVGGANVISLEPVPANFSALKANLELNSLQSLRARPVAAGRDTGSRDFVYAKDNLTMGTFASCTAKLDIGGLIFQVPSITLDKLADEEGSPPHVIKIDVEGAAGEVLAGCNRILQSSRPNLFIELHLSPRQNYEHSAVASLVQDHDYRVQMLDGLPLETERPEGEYHAWCTYEG